MTRPQPPAPSEPGFDAVPLPGVRYRPGMRGYVIENLGRATERDPYRCWIGEDWALVRLGAALVWPTRAAALRALRPHLPPLGNGRRASPHRAGYSVMKVAGAEYLTRKDPHR